MGDPEIRNDEQVLIRTHGIHVKSIPFEGILTSRRIILVDRAKNILPPKEIPLATISEIEVGENGLRDPTLTISVMAKTGETRQMIFTFSRQEGGNRAREVDEWVRAIQASTSAPAEQVARKGFPGSAAPRVDVTNSPVQPYNDAPRQAPARRIVDTAPPVRKVAPAGMAGTPVAAPAPPAGETVFCTRCGNRVIADSAFCNRCGTPVVAPAARTAPPPQYAAPEPVRQPPPARAPAVSPQVTGNDAALRDSLAWDDEPVAAPAPVQRPPARPAAQKPAKKGFLSGLFGSRKQRETAAAPRASKPSRGGRSFMPGRKTLIAIGAVIVVILVVAALAVFVYPMLSSGDLLPSSDSSSGSSSGTTKALTADTVVIKETPAVVIPSDGVYVRISYLGSWKGTYGMPDDLQTEINSGDRYYEVVNASGMVTAAFQKQDSSTKQKLVVSIYKDGKELKSDSTSKANGKVSISADVGGSTAAAASDSTATESDTGGNATVTDTSAAAVTTTTVNTSATTSSS
jgi:hypothetical protein